MRKSWFISGLFLFLISFSSTADTIDFWQFRRNDTLVAQGFPAFPLKSKPIEVSLAEVRKGQWSIIYGGCFPPKVLFLKIISGVIKLEFNLNASNRFQLELPENAEQYIGWRWTCYLRPDRSADHVEDYFQWLDIVLKP